jgi:hypothetical protein
MSSFTTEDKTLFARVFASRSFPEDVVAKLGIQHVDGVIVYDPSTTTAVLDLLSQMFAHRNDLHICDEIASDVSQIRFDANSGAANVIYVVTVENGCNAKLSEPANWLVVYTNKATGCLHVRMTYPKRG